ncbi:FMN-binding protein [bacterium]|nr:FMN-binding protein [bacterium]
MKNNLITGLVLSIFALICGLFLSLVNSFTEPVIKERTEQKINDSIMEVCEIYKNNKDTYSIDKESITHEEVDSVYLVKDENGNAVEAIYIVSAKGYASTIQMMISVTKEHKIEKSIVISSQETKGNIKTHDFKMDGKDSLDSFDKLSGSTISSKAVRKCFYTALDLSYEDLK